MVKKVSFALDEILSCWKRLKCYFRRGRKSSSRRETTWAQDPVDEALRYIAYATPSKLHMQLNKKYLYPLKNEELRDWMEVIIWQIGRERILMAFPEVPFWSMEVIEETSSRTVATHSSNSPKQKCCESRGCVYCKITIDHSWFCYVTVKFIEMKESVHRSYMER